MSTTVEEQFSDVLPPRAGQTLAVTLDANARSYDLTALDMGGVVPEADAKRRIDVFLYMQADTAGAFYNFSPTAKTINDATTVAAGGTLAYADAHCAKLEATAIVRLRLNRSVDKFLNVKGTGAGTLRLWVASEAR